MMGVSFMVDPVSKFQSIHGLIKDSLRCILGIISEEARLLGAT
jgi:hypothetical protein